MARLKGKDISTHTLTWSVTETYTNKDGYETISTHTLTWSVTGAASGMLRHDNRISTHTLTWSVTSSPKENGTERNFNSHAHVERDPAAMMMAKPTRTFQLTRSRGA